MNDLPTTVIVLVLTFASFCACAILVARLVRPDRSPRLRRLQHVLVGTSMLLAALLLVYRMYFVYDGSWQPLRAHVDGLVLMAGLLSAATLFLQSGKRLPEFSGFGLPLQTFLFAWAICASWWSYELFEMTSVWRTFHLASVYLGTLSVAVAAVAAGMYLYVRRRLRAKRDLNSPGRFGSLEAIERSLISVSMLAFALITLVMVTGLVIRQQDPDSLGPGWWYSGKVVSATGAWIVYAVLMNIRRSSYFRGKRAAWMAIGGLLMLLVSLGVSS